MGKRYKAVAEQKSDGATYTPKLLADFVSEKIVDALKDIEYKDQLRILDPALGDGELLISMLEQLSGYHNIIEIHGFETDEKALNSAAKRLKQEFPNIVSHLQLKSFLEDGLDHLGADGYENLFSTDIGQAYDLIIANPPYVRTQIMGAGRARLLARQFKLSGRVDLYHAFILAIARVLKPRGVAGIIVSNRFMTTRSGASVRRAILREFNLSQVWDLGDSKLFDSAVLPAVLIAEGKAGYRTPRPAFCSIYETKSVPCGLASNPIAALSRDGVIATEGGRCFQVLHGQLDTGDTADGVWRMTSDKVASWLNTVNVHSWGTFRDIGKIRVGVKTCSDKVFIRSDWARQAQGEPELLKPIITHHIARRFKALTPNPARKILYPHESINGKRRTIDLSNYPSSRAYLERHRLSLEGRGYVIEAGREWYEIWVPQDPSAWDQIKLVFRDIAKQPEFWIDREKSVVNGDCYWLICQAPKQTDLLWLACAVANSSFIEAFYDRKFNNRLYAGRRRFMTQYVEQFPLPDPDGLISRTIIETAKNVYARIASPAAEILQRDINKLVWEAFGLGNETDRV